ncbi:BC1872 family protein [Sporolactobacillus terrae]|uniref:BC1872 family protein n=1 Tax=Sporolactobacillus terrae TaxID=269673 RepID=UPI00056CDCC5|nr:hypothetical protein [Sporolactobacillus terrae]
MGEIAAMMLSGFYCEQCGCLIDGEETGYPRLCEDCARESKPKRKKTKNENAVIDSKLAEAMGYKQLVENEGYLWEPSTDMSDAWEVSERFGLDSISRNQENGTWTAVFKTNNGLIVQTESTAPLAICKAALKIIEGSKSDE